MLYLKRLIYKNFITFARQATPQFDILNTGMWVFQGIKSPIFKKNFPPDRTTAAPEGTAVLIGLLMNKVVKQVLVL
jgi:hypothetical protein